MCCIGILFLEVFSKVKRNTLQIIVTHSDVNDVEILYVAFENAADEGLLLYSVTLLYKVGNLVYRVACRPSVNAGD